MQYKQFGNTWMVRIDLGEDIIEQLKKLCVEEHILLGRVEAIGATDHAVIGVYDLAKKEYYPEEINEFMEIASLNGNITAMDGNEAQLSYGASKAALIGAMKTMALELGKTGIRVNAVAPGVIKTPMTAALDEGVIEKKVRTMDMPRLGEPHEVAELFMFLMSDLSSHITGQTIRIDGGIR